MSDGQQKKYFRALLIDMSFDDYDREYLLLNKAFKKARENEDIIHGGLNLNPLLAQILQLHPK